MAKMKNCKHCGQEIAASAKVCPYCGGKNKKPIYKRVWFWLLIVGALLIGVSSAGTKQQSVTGSGTSGTTDSGGSSSKEEENLYEITNIHTSVTFNSYDNNYYYDGIVEIVNISDENIEITSEKFDVVNSEGVSVSHDSFSLATCPEIIAPGEKGYIYTMFSQALTDVSEEESQNLDLNYSFNVSTVSRESHRYPVTDINVSPETYGDGATCTGTIENDTDKDDDYIYVNVIYYDSDNKPICVAGTSITDLSAGKKAKFEISGILTNVEYSEIASYTVIAER